jgi:hypothetical protein
VVATGVPVHVMTAESGLPNGARLELDVGLEGLDVPGLPAGHLRVLWSAYQADIRRPAHPSVSCRRPRSRPPSDRGVHPGGPRRTSDDLRTPRSPFDQGVRVGLGVTGGDTVSVGVGDGDGEISTVGLGDGDGDGDGDGWGEILPVGEGCGAGVMPGKSTLGVVVGCCSGTRTLTSPPMRACAGPAEPGSR